MVEYKIFLFGLDNAGKTTILSFIKGEPNLETEPTRTFNVVDVILEDTNVVVWDCPGQIKYRSSWDNGLHSVNILMFVLDTNDSARFEEALGEFNKIVKNLDESKAPLIFCYNKMDLKKAKKNITTAKKMFELSEIIDRLVFPAETSIKTPETIVKIKFILAKIILVLQKKSFKKE